MQPETATRVGRTDHNDRWRDWSKAARDRLRKDREEFLQKAMYLSPGNLNPTDLVTSLLMEHELRTQLEAQDYLNLVQVVSQSDGVHNEVFNVIDQMPARTVKDYENIIARLRALPAYIDQTIESDARAARGGSRAAGDRRRPDARSGRRAEQDRRRPTRRCSPRFAGSRPRSRQPIRIGCARRLVAAYEQQFVPALEDGSRRSSATPTGSRPARRRR